jgi:glutamyl-tRNA reductase
VHLREAWAAVGNLSQLKELVAAHHHLSPAIEFVLLSTCNRFDICFFGKIRKINILNIFYHLHQLAVSQNKGIECDLTLSEMENLIRIDFDEHGLRTLFQVTASLDSLVLGESQILGQVKDAYFQAVEHGVAQHLARPVFHRNFRVAKKVRTETGVGKNGVSIGHAAIDIIARVFDSLEGKKILILGAGEMARITAQHFLFSGAKHLFIANRNIVRAQRLAQDLGKVLPLDLQDVLCRIWDFDICIAAASGNEYLLHKSHLQDYAKKRNGNLSVMVDISVPRKIDPLVSEIESLFLFNVDDLDSVMEKNRQDRKAAAAQAEKIIEAEVQAYLFACHQKENLMNVGRFHSWVKAVVEHEIHRVFYDLNRGKKINKNAVCEAVAKKMVSHAAFLAKNNMRPLNGDNCSVADLLEFLFCLSRQPLSFRKKFYKEENVLPFSFDKKRINS